LIGVIPSNLRALRLYESRGFTPAWVTLTRYQRAPVLPVRNVAADDITIVNEYKLNALKPLWLSLHHHHQAVSPHLGPWVEDALSWSVISELLAKSARDHLLFVAKRANQPIGLASVTIYNMTEYPMWSDTLLTEDRLAETKFLVVSDNARGNGVGMALMAAVDEALAKRGVRDHFIGAIAPNTKAIRFYESLGYIQTWIEFLKV
jgi:ribosomal protein S18 acetylase RimI-like enzyme